MEKLQTIILKTILIIVLLTMVISMNVVTFISINAQYGMYQLGNLSLTSFIIPLMFLVGISLIMSLVATVFIPKIIRYEDN